MTKQKKKHKRCRARKHQPTRTPRGHGQQRNRGVAKEKASTHRFGDFKKMPHVGVVMVDRWEPGFERPWYYHVQPRPGGEDRRRDDRRRACPRM